MYKTINGNSPLVESKVGKTSDPITESYESFLSEMLSGLVTKSTVVWH